MHIADLCAKMPQIPCTNRCQFTVNMMHIQIVEMGWNLAANCCKACKWEMFAPKCSKWHSKEKCPNNTSFFAWNKKTIPKNAARPKISPVLIAKVSPRFGQGFPHWPPSSFSRRNGYNRSTSNFSTFSCTSLADFNQKHGYLGVFFWNGWVRGTFRH